MQIEKIKKWRGALSLKNKLQIPIQAVLLLIMVFVQRWMSNQPENRVMDKTKQKGMASAGSVVNGLILMSAAPAKQMGLSLP